MVRRKKPRKFAGITRGSGGPSLEWHGQKYYGRGKGFFTLSVDSARIGSPRIANNIARFTGNRVSSFWGEEYF